MNLTVLLDMACNGLGERVVVGRRAEGMTARDLRSRARRGARAVREAKAPAVVYVAPHGPAFPVAMFAAAIAGVPLIPLNYRLSPGRLDKLLANHSGAFVIADSAPHSVVPQVSDQAITPQEWLELTAGSCDPLAVPETPSDIAVVIYTSGTTSDPKGVLLRHGNLFSYVVESVDFCSADESRAALVSVPPYHIAAVASVLTNLYAGRRVISLERFTPDEWLSLVRSEGVTNALVVPTMLARILDSGCDLTVPTLESLAYGGSPMPTAVIDRALVAWPDVNFVNSYGLTETSSTITILNPQDHRDAVRSDDERVRARLSSVGKPIPGIELEIRDPDGELVGPGIRGRVWVRGAQVSAEYAGIGSVLDERGFFDTRDNGHVDKDGYLFVDGRADDTIIRGAENIAPAEIEDVLLRHPAVADAAVIGIPDEEWGQRIMAVVVVRTGQTPDGEELRAFVRSALRSSKTPDGVVFWNGLPRNEAGKLVRGDVTARYLGEARAQSRVTNAAHAP